MLTDAKNPDYLSDDDLQPSHEVVPVLAIAEEIRADPRCHLPTPEYGKVLKQVTREVLLSKINIEKAYQRNPNVPHILDIASNFDQRSMMIPQVVQRNYNGGEIVSPEGQQRLIAAALLGFKSVTCNIVEANSIEEEADIFEKINIHRKAVPTPVTHRNRVIQREDRALTLERTVREAGFTIGERDGNLRIKGISRLHATGATYGYPMLGKALETYRTIWPDHRAIHLYLNSGIAMLLWTYLDPRSPTFSEDTVRDVNPDLLSARIHRAFADPKAVIQYTAPQTSLNKRTLGMSLAGGRPNETFRRENDYWYALTLIQGFNKGGFPRGVRGLSKERVYQSYMFLKGHRNETDDIRAAAMAALYGDRTVNP